MKSQKQYTEEYARIGGIDHYLLHYRAKPEDPVLLFIHGGPGQTESFFAFLVEEYAERDYNIVYYDQRGAGKTWLRNKKSKPDTETLKKDLLEMVLYLKKQYGKEKIGILGHSWGAFSEACSRWNTRNIRCVTSAAGRSLTLWKTSA